MVLLYNIVFRPKTDSECMTYPQQLGKVCQVESLSCNHWYYQKMSFHSTPAKERAFIVILQKREHFTT